MENPTGIPSDFLRIEFKTQPVNRKSLRGRFTREQYRAGENFRKVQFENEQIRVTRLVCAAHQSLDVMAISPEPALFIVLSSARLKSIGAEGKAKQMTFEPGQTIWLAGGRQKRLENLGDVPVELLRFDFRTDPANSKARPKKRGDSRGKFDEITSCRLSEIMIS